jgi:hypothetical protein
VLAVPPVEDGIDHWSSLLEEVKAPADLIPALACGRPELLCLVAPRAMTVEESGAMVNLVRVLLETNQHLQARCASHAGKWAEMRAEAAVARDALRRITDALEERPLGAEEEDR